MSTVLPLLLEPLLPELELLLLLLLLLPQATIPMTEPTSTQPVTALPRVRILLLWMSCRAPSGPREAQRIESAGLHASGQGRSPRRPNLTATRRASATDLLPEPPTAADNPINAVTPEGCVAVGLDA